MSTTDAGSSRLRLHSWLHPSIVGVALVSIAAGFGQFGAVAALGDVAKAFGHMTHGTTIADQAGLSGTELGIGLAVLRLASLASLPLTGVADRIGRRKMLVGTCVLGLCMTILASLSPGYWWFVAIFAIGRPLLSTTTAVAQVSAAEASDSANRSRSIALVAAGYGLGSGLITVVHSLAGHALGFRGVFALAAIPLVLVLLRASRLQETERYVLEAATSNRPLPVLGALDPLVRRRLAVVASISFCVAVMTGPANSFIYIYSQNVLHMSGVAIAAMVSCAAITGLAGLLLGQRMADHLGRRPAAAIAVLAMGATGLIAYSGSRVALVVGYLVAVLAASSFAPAAGSLGNELFPTSIRASVAGFEIGASVLGGVVGLLVFGALADIGNRFSLGAIVTSTLAIPACLLFALLPETNGVEPEQLWPIELRRNPRA